MANISDEIKRDKFEGGLLGLMLGDALGAPHEFRGSKDEYTGKLQYPPRIPSRYQGVRHGVVAQTSDDTELMLALIYSMIPDSTSTKVIEYNNERAAMEYMKWANSKPMGMGFNTRALFCGVKTVNGFRNRQVKVFKKVSQSNGSLMRCYPLALIPKENWYADVNLSNPTKVNRDASKVFLSLVQSMWAGKGKAEALEEQINDKTLASPITAALFHASEIDGVFPSKVDSSFPCQPYEVSGKCKGWVAVSLYTAIWGWYHSNTLEDCLDSIIERGGDTDTNAAIGGALMGSTLGKKACLKETRVKKNWKILRNANPEEGDFPRPNKYLCSNTREISAALGM
uniref:ADP-ribosylglycohydrolase n=1 Tax=Marseillevirus LCMAC101 TaxID=2506602 RepID=A0A481YRH6_9VIRU|nr:MAG: ADP-ribosylglycohydrolase [Marseillevirus LCMAC101]